jgi:hypothetical protein
MFFNKKSRFTAFRSKTKKYEFFEKSYRLLFKNGHLFLSIFQKPLPLYFSVFYGGLFYH